MANAISVFRVAAHNTFLSLKPLFSENTNYWRLGHSFDTIIDYFVVSPYDANDFTEVALSRYLNSTGTACWYDDYGWWGIAGLKASQHSDLFGTFVSCFSGIADSCWRTMDNHAPNVWKNADESEFGSLKPRFDGGVWNYFWSMQIIDGVCQTPCDPRKRPICGFQNSVTNGLYLVLASRLYEVTKETKYLDAAKREYNFLDHWFNVADSTQVLLNRYAEGKAVVRERVSTYARDGRGNYPPVNSYNPALAWTGDQGLFLGGLVDLMRISGKDSSDYDGYLTIAKEISAGVKDSLVQNSILTAWTPDQLPPGNDFDDYSTGIAVYMRYLLYAYQINDALRTYLQNTGYPDFIRANAEYVIQNPPKKDDMVGLTNGLATLVAAIVICK